MDWILEQRLPFDSLYFYGAERPIHISYGPQQKRDIWMFTAKGTPTRKGVDRWVSGWVVGLGLVVETAGNDNYAVVFDFINQAMLGVDSAGPVAR
ncbi:MAG: hypothetical protein VKJ64_07620 [Leptolyngbyaceae bacterium]|nr:hypothetical protein [Leptolyngbyaceae bacterium]